MKDLTLRTMPVEVNNELEPQKVKRKMKLSYLAFNATHKLIFSNETVNFIFGVRKHIVS